MKLRTKFLTLTIPALTLTPIVMITSQAPIENKGDLDREYGGIFYREYDLLDIERTIEGEELDVKLALVEPGLVAHTRGVLESNSFAEVIGSGEKSWHKTLIANILVGKNGINPKGKIYDIEYDEHIDFMEKMGVLAQKGIDVVSLSYGYGDRWKKIYDENAWYLDYLSRTFGITFVISTGNTGWAQWVEDGPESEYIKEIMFGRPYVDGHTLSLNTIKVGSVGQNKNTKNYEQINTKKGLEDYYNQRSGFSNFRTEPDGFKAKGGVSIVAPGSMTPLQEVLKDAQDEKVKKMSGDKYTFGTSFSTPLVAGTLVKTLNNHRHLKKKPHASLALITLSGVELTKHQSNLTNGLNSQVGAGLMNAKLMHQAAQNIKTYTFDKDIESGTLVDDNNYNSIHLSKGQQINATVAWMHNSFYLHDKMSNRYSQYTKTFEKNIKKAFYPAFKSPMAQGLIKIEDLITNYDLEIQKRNGNSWEIVASSNSTSSNVELAKYTATSEQEEIRIVVKKQGQSNAGSEASDKLAVGHIII